MKTSSINRRQFLKQTGMASALAVSGLGTNALACMTTATPRPFEVKNVNATFEREPLARPFGFKGGAITQVWQPVVQLESGGGHKKVGLGTQSVLWSDAKVFAAHTENGGNALMFAMTEHALQLIKGQTFADPLAMLDQILEPVWEYGKKITENPNLRKTFALNALVPVDNAAWLVYAAENGFTQFDQMIPEAYRPGVSDRLAKVAAIPALSYGVSMDEIRKLAEAGYFIMKIKIGAPGTQAEMLEKDKAFLKAIHETIGGFETPHTADGKLPYYFDANGRYDRKDDLHRFLDYAEKIGALAQIAVMEEPFGERNQGDVSDIAERGPRVAADESAHTDEDSRTRIEQGYNCIAVKAIAKTLSMTLKIAQLAEERATPCFCADLTVNPILVDWNKCVAARLAPFPGLDFGLQETNGWQNYKYWNEMKARLPDPGASWVEAENGVYRTGEDFFQRSGGVLTPSAYYEGLFS
jgi:L-alanine-DL-glutamate epimerase-like enolase superfamily enzyme